MVRKPQESMPVTKVERSARFVKTGFKIGGNYLKHYSKKLFNPDLDREQLNEDNAADIYESLSELKGSALKVAQMLSMDKNILPRAYVEKFSLSQYNAPALSGPLIVQTFRKSIGKSPQEVFDEFEMQSVRAASIGQVHRARKDGRDLAVKIQYPGVGDSISSDLKMVKPIAFRLLNMSEKELTMYMQEVEERLLEETDYTLEVERSMNISRQCGHLSNLVFPEYYPELSSGKIITMDWMHGLHLKEFLETNPSIEERNLIGQALWDFYQFQQHTLKAVHADPHPGNFLITDEGKLAIIDFGCIKTFTQEFYDSFFSLLEPGALDNRAQTIESFRTLGMIHPGDTDAQVRFYYDAYKEMISLFSLPFQAKRFDFSKPDFFRKLYSWSEKVAKTPEFKQARGSRHFIYTNRTNFGLFNLLHDLGATVDTSRYTFLNQQVSETHELEN